MQLQPTQTHLSNRRMLRRTALQDESLVTNGRKLHLFWLFGWQAASFSPLNNHFNSFDTSAIISPPPGVVQVTLLPLEQPAEAVDGFKGGGLVGEIARYIKHE